MDTYQTYIFIYFSIINMKYLVQAFYRSIIAYCKRKYCAQHIFCVAYHASWPTDTQECTDCMDLLITRLTALKQTPKYAYHIDKQTQMLKIHFYISINTYTIYVNIIS